MQELTKTEIDEVNGAWLGTAAKVVSGWLGLNTMAAEGGYTAASQAVSTTAHNIAATASSTIANPQSFTAAGISTYGSPSGH